MVKADAYGHGLTAVAKALTDNADEFAVATYSEAQSLYNAGIRKPINILGADFDICDAIPQNSHIMPNIIPTVCDISQVKALKNKVQSVNVKLNTGMNRLGVSADKLDALICELKNSGIVTRSIFTHFYKGDDLSDCRKQFELFDSATVKYAESGIRRHCCASCCVCSDSKFYCDMVRCGIAMYGYSPITSPVMSIHTNILQVSDVKAGEHVGYGNYVSPCDMKIAAIRAGYADGYRRIVDKKRYVSINGKLCSVVGQVCMDITLVNVTEIPLYGNDRVYLLGGGVSGEMLAKSCDTIVYEILTSFKGRIKRNYIG